MKSTDGLRYGQKVSFRGMRGTVLGRPRDAKGKYLIGCNDGVKRMVLACELTPVPAATGKKNG